MGSGEDQRKSRRRAVVLRIKLRYEEVDEFITKFATNVSEAGMFVRSKKPKDVGTIVAFELRLADGSAVIRGRGEVRWTRSFDPDKPRQPYGMGVEFTQLDPESKALIKRIVTLKRKQGIAVPDGAIPYQLPDADSAAGENGGENTDAPAEAAPEAPEANAEAAPEAPEANAEAAPEPVEAAPPATALPPEPPRKARTTVGEMLDEVGETTAAPEPPADNLDGVLDGDVSMSAALARARQLTSADAADDLLSDLASPEPVTDHAAELKAKLARNRQRRAEARAARGPLPAARTTPVEAKAPAPEPEPEAKPEPPVVEAPPEPEPEPPVVEAPPEPEPEPGPPRAQRPTPPPPPGSPERHDRDETVPAPIAAAPREIERAAAAETMPAPLPEDGGVDQGTQVSAPSLDLEPLPDPGTLLGVGLDSSAPPPAPEPPAPAPPAPEPPEPALASEPGHAPKPLEMPSDNDDFGLIGALLEDDDEIDAALASLLPGDDEPSGGPGLPNLEVGDEVGFHRTSRGQRSDQARADQAQDAVDNAIAAAEGAGDFVEDLIEFDFGDDDEAPAPLPDDGAIDLGDLPPLDEVEPGDPTFISDMPSAALASDLAADSRNQLGGGRSLDELLDPEEPLPGDRIHGVEDFIDESPSDAAPLGVDLDATLAALETDTPEPPPPIPPPPPPPGHRKTRASMPPPPPPPPSPPRPNESLELDIDVDAFSNDPIETVPPEPIHEYPDTPSMGDDVDPLVDPGTEQIERKKKGLFKRIFGKD